MKTLIVYGSHHHNNTHKLVNTLADSYPITLLDAEKEAPPVLDPYDRIGFASGIDFGKFYPAVTSLARQLPPGKKVFALFTCAKDNGKYGDEIAQIALSRGCLWLGKFGCRGYNTYGPWKLIGGMNKHHPSPSELEAAKAFFGTLFRK